MKLAAALGLGIGGRAAGPLFAGTAAAILIAVAGARLAARGERSIWPGTVWPLAPLLVAGVVLVAYALH